ncbi:hypothetical protein IMCC3135_16450 [Granulosicoccus antarcticus IMCC3135]|uniref:Uncharacterized protein n=1 Tax=Granulosicoccus antarcticus IMCC3135 TaxID=1192854 RepID=A0A2Z2NPF9_9GAMM|nr:hypothetical protein IMCC3135_16450 [Granulosicoccus antarcticus IMCC3135]
MKTDISATQTLQSEQPHPAFRSYSSRLKERLRGRSLLLVAGMVVVGTGMALNWDWLTAMGAAPIILSLAPCALMCTVGICCSKKGTNQT